MSSWRRFVVALLIVTTASFNVVAPAQAALIATGSVLAAGANPRERIASALTRADVHAALASYGVDPQQASARVAAMTDDEARQIAGKIDALPAGGEIIEALLIVFLVLLLTDILGFTKIFPFTRPIR